MQKHGVRYEEVTGNIFIFTALSVSCDLGLLDKDVSFFPSIETVNGKLKKFNDALYAGLHWLLK